MRLIGISQCAFSISFLFFFFLNLFIYFWLRWVFVSARGPSPVAASGGHSSSWCAGLSPSRPLLLRSTGSRRAGSVIVAHGPSRSVACGIFPDQGSNPRPLHQQADSQPLRHQGSPFSISWKLYSTLPRFVDMRNLCLQYFLPTLSWLCSPPLPIVTMNSLRIAGGLKKQGG